LKPWNVLITGSSGLIGSEAVEYFDRLGHTVTGIDNNMRRLLFGPSGDTEWNLRRLQKSTKRFRYSDIDLRDYTRVFDLFARERFDGILEEMVAAEERQRHSAGAV
jgi:CDP-paratose 2-epimerase